MPRIRKRPAPKTAKVMKNFGPPRRIKMYTMNKIMPEQRIQNLAFLFGRNIDIFRFAGILVSHRKVPESLGEDIGKYATYLVKFDGKNILRRYYVKKNRFLSMIS